MYKKLIDIAPEHRQWVKLHNLGPRIVERKYKNYLAKADLGEVKLCISQDDLYVKISTLFSTSTGVKRMFKLAGLNLQTIRPHIDKIAEYAIVEKQGYTKTSFTTPKNPIMFRKESYNASKKEKLVGTILMIDIVSAYLSNSLDAHYQFPDNRHNIESVQYYSALLELFLSDIMFSFFKYRNQSNISALTFSGLFDGSLEKSRELLSVLKDSGIIDKNTNKYVLQNRGVSLPQKYSEKSQIIFELLELSIDTKDEKQLFLDDILSLQYSQQTIKDALNLLKSLAEESDSGISEQALGTIRVLSPDSFYNYFDDLKINHRRPHKYGKLRLVR